jgi:hypothetical protein
VAIHPPKQNTYFPMTLDGDNGVYNLFSSITGEELATVATVDITLQHRSFSAKK